ncbi:MAG: alpha/beta fold hydrolase [Pseudomonadota bacterium]
MDDPAATARDKIGQLPTMDGSDTSWLQVVKRADRGSTILVCLPHAGGTVLSAAKLAHAVSSRFEVLVTELPGRRPGDKRPTPRRAIPVGARLANELATYVAEDGAGRRLVLLGNSYGALLAFETALSLLSGHSDRLDEAHLQVIVSGFRSPSLPPSDSPLYRLPTDDLRTELLHRFDLSPAELDTAGLVDIEPSLRADLEACDTYRPRRGITLPCQVDVLNLTRDASVSLTELLAWQQVATRPIRRRDIDGGHFPWTSRAAAVAEAVSSLVNEAPA